MLAEYRLFRRKCLEYLRGDAPTSVMNQVHGLAWHTAVFRTLNEARRLETERAVNGAMWELIGDVRDAPGPCPSCRHATRCIEGLACEAFALFERTGRFSAVAPRQPCRAIY